jgi:two-component system chemotaxis response regulator CheY
LRSLGTILLAEDDDAVRTAMSLLLKSAGYDVVEAVDGMEAMDRLLAGSASLVLVILDLAMPRVSGWTFREQQLADAEFALIPTIVLSGTKLTPEDLERLRARAVISKPFLFDELLRFVRAYAKPVAGDYD